MGESLRAWRGVPVELRGLEPLAFWKQTTGVSLHGCRHPSMRRMSGVAAVGHRWGRLLYPLLYSSALNLLIGRSGQIVQDRLLPVMCWADVPELSARDRPCPTAWQQYWQQTAGAWTAREPNRISSSGRGRPKRFNLDRRQWLVLTGRFRTMANCNPNCNPSYAL
jgi:hypothetical protein